MKKKCREKEKEKKAFLFSFLILGGRDSTRALQSSLFQNPGGYPERDGVVGVVVVVVVVGRHFPFLIYDSGVWCK